MTHSPGYGEYLGGYPALGLPLGPARIVVDTPRSNTQSIVPKYLCLSNELLPHENELVRIARAENWIALTFE